VARATAVFVLFRSPTLDLSWIPADRPVNLVHNDSSFDRASLDRPLVTHLGTGENVGFGRGVNAALGSVETDRVVVANPDTHLTEAHWHALEDAGDDELVGIPLVRSDGAPTSIVNRYPTPASLLLTAFNAGRLLPVGHPLRAKLSRLLGRWGRSHEALAADPTGRFPLTTHWLSGAVFSVATDRLRAIGGFDDDYFLYLEDNDLCQRLGRAFPTMEIVVPSITPGEHEVSASSAGPALRRARAAHVAASAAVLAGRQRGAGWRAVKTVSGLRARALGSTRR
jgi:hypothetical protein